MDFALFKSDYRVACTLAVCEKASKPLISYHLPVFHM